MDKQAESKITVKAVVAYAVKLREDAAKACVRDPYAKPYMPSVTYARRLAFRVGPEEAIAHLRGNAAMAQREQREQAEISKRSLERHKRRQADAKKDRDRRVANLRPGERIDLAIAQLSLIASPAAANPEPSSPNADSDFSPKFTVDMADPWKRKAQQLAREIEDALFDAQSRNVRQIAA